MKAEIDFNDYFDVAEHLRIDLGLDDYNFYISHVPFPTDMESYNHFIKIYQYLDNAIDEYNQK